MCLNVNRRELVGDRGGRQIKTTFINLAVRWSESFSGFSEKGSDTICWVGGKGRDSGGLRRGEA
jgi:hypothetical protein